MGPAVKWKRIFAGMILLMAALTGVILALLFSDGDWLPESMLGRLFRYQPVRSIAQLEPGQDLRWKSLRKLDLAEEGAVIPMLRFNLSTRWPKAEKLPLDFSPEKLLANAMNPGLGVRELHRAGITGKGVNVGIIDYNLYGRHPEYAGQLAEVHRLEGVRNPTMHGPAVASLLVGKQIGTAPQAKLYFIAVPDDGQADAAADAKALELILERNTTFPPADRIRVVSVSASPSGKGLWKYRNSQLWEEACRRADQAGVLVIEGGGPRAFIGPCVLDASDPENPAKCTPVLAQGNPEFFAERLLAPIGPRTTAEEYYAGDQGYQYCGPLQTTRLDAGSSWAMPYAAGVLALGWQIRPDLSAPVMKQLLIGSAHVLPDGKLIIDPRSFIERVRNQ
jgi:serine protease AprX